jgi:hypothetical protein
LIKAINVDKVYNFEEIIDLFQTTLGKNLSKYNSNIINIFSIEYFDCKYGSYSIKEKVLDNKLMIENIYN